MHDGQTGERCEHQLELARVPLWRLGHRHHRARDDRQQQHEPGLEEQRQADHEGDQQTHPWRARLIGPADHQSGKARRAVRELQHRTERHAERHDETCATQDIPGTFLHGLGRVGHRQAAERTDREGAAKERHEGMQPAAHDEPDRERNARDGSEYQPKVGQLPTCPTFTE